MIKPCPFCGGEAKVIKRTTAQWYTWQVACKKCKAQTWEHYATMKGAIEAWNRRTEQCSDL